MNDRVRTLILYATGAPRWERVVFETISGMLVLDAIIRRGVAMLPPRWRESRYAQFLAGNGYGALSYVLDWKDAFCEAPELDVELCNVNNFFEYRSCTEKIREYPLIVVLHSAAGDSLSVIRGVTRALQARRGTLLVFFGNEYSLMKEKIAFARETAAEYIASQLPEPAAQWLYEDCPSAKILPAPGALNPRVYFARAQPRPIDLGFRGDAYWSWLGDNERTQLLECAREHGPAWELVVDIEFTRRPREQWSEFLNRCHGIIGAESGTYYLERDDHTQEAVKRYLKRRPQAPFDELYERFFKDYRASVSGKAISSRHFEPVGTKTCQILLEGHYNGLLVAGEHYISVKKDLSNIDDAIREFRDEEYRRAIVERAYEYVLARHTYRHRVETILRTVLGTVT